MTDRYENIRKALAMGPTPGPWLVCPTNSGVFVKSERVSGYLAEVRHCRTTQDVRADAHLIAACDPDTIRELLAERDQLAADLEAAREDAERWRALREMDGGEIYALLGDCDGIHPEQADAAIDRACGKESRMEEREQRDEALLRGRRL
jgi:hypothetical protein